VITAALTLPETELPRHSIPGDGPPPPSRWPDRDPVAAARLARARAALAEIAATHTLPAENLLTPDLVRRLSWSPPEPADDETVAAHLRHAGARNWQIALTAGPLAQAMTATAEPDELDGSDQTDGETLEADPDVDGP
jgi:ribonuclease D